MSDEFVRPEDSAANFRLRRLSNYLKWHHAYGAKPYLKIVLHSALLRMLLQSTVLLYVRPA